MRKPLHQTVRADTAHPKLSAEDYIATETDLDLLDAEHVLGVIDVLLPVLKSYRETVRGEHAPPHTDGYPDIPFQYRKGPAEPRTVEPQVVRQHQPNFHARLVRFLAPRTLNATAGELPGHGTIPSLPEARMG